MENQKPNTEPSKPLSKKAKIITLIVFVLIAALMFKGCTAYLAYGERYAEQEEKQKAIDAKKAKEKAAEQKVYNEKMKHVSEFSLKEVVKKANKENTTAEAKLREVAVKGTDGYRMARIDLDVADSIDGEGVEFNAQSNALPIIKQLSKMDKFDEVLLMYYLPLVDKYGNEEKNVVVQIRIKSETLKKINFKNFYEVQIPDVADYYWVHQALKK